MCGPFGCRPTTGSVKPCWICLLIVVAGMVIPQFADADPGLLEHPPEGAVSIDHGTDGEIGEAIPPQALDRALAAHRAHKLRQRLFYTATPGEGALSGIRLGMSAGHGIQWYSDQGKWSFQRGIQDFGWGGLREDIHTNQTMIDFLLDMVERAGATTVTMRERNYGEHAVVVDNDGGDGYSESGTWADGASEGFGGTYRYAYLAAGGDATATWHFSVPETGEYPVYVYFLAGGNRTDAATYTVEHYGGHTTRTVSQAKLLPENWPSATYPNIPPGSEADVSSNDLWHYLGTYPFEKGVDYTIELSNDGSDDQKVVIADAVRVGAGEGFIKGGNGQPSGRPRWEEASVPYIKWVGAPDWIRVNDVSERPLYSIYRGVDAYFALHTNAGGGTGTSTYTWYPEMYVKQSDWGANFAHDNLPPGTVDWGDRLHQEVLRQIRARWDDQWTDRGRMGANFGELRAFEKGWHEDKYSRGAANPLDVPSALMELAFHDNAYDARFLREMEFRKDAARAILVAMIRHFKGDNALIPPLAPKAVHARAVDGNLEVSWKPAEDTVYPNSQPDRYKVYTSTDGLIFDTVPIETDGPSVSIPLSGCEALYVRVTAVNDAGESLDSPVVGGQLAHQGGVHFLYVDGVDREVKTVEDPNNPRTYARIYGPALAAAEMGAGFDMTTDDDAGRAIAQGQYDVVVWATGETSTRNESLSQADQQVISQLLQNGTRVIVSGAEMGWDLVEKGSDTDKAFFQDTLGAAYVQDDAGSTEVDATALGMSTITFGDCSHDANCVQYPDVLDKQAGGSVLLAYASGAAAVESADGSVITVGFPLETVADPAKRQDLIVALVGQLLGDGHMPAGDCPISQSGGDTGGADAGGNADAGLPGDDTGTDTDAGGADDDAGTTTSSKISTNEGCGCGSTGQGVPGGFVALVFVVGVGVVRRRRG